jgi:hypothetical protein
MNLSMGRASIGNKNICAEVTSNSFAGVIQDEEVRIEAEERSGQGRGKGLGLAFFKPKKSR